jgi:hypothetical protein
VISWWRTALATLVLCCLLTAATMPAGRLLPRQDSRTLLARNPCALPCFFGVTPGATTREHAMTALAPYVDVTRVSDYLLTFALVDSEGRIAFASVDIGVDGVVESVQLAAVNWVADIGQLGDVLRTRPVHVFKTCTGVRPTRFLLSIGALNEITVELLPGTAIAPDTPISVFTERATGTRTLDDIRSSFGCAVEVGWRGFAPLWRYVTPDV